MFREVEVRGSLGCGLQDFPKVLDLVTTGKVDAKALVSHRFPLEKTADALALLESSAPDLIRAVVAPGGEHPTGRTGPLQCLLAEMHSPRES